MVINFEQVHNYYERLVFEAVARRSRGAPGLHVRHVGRLACVALNRLPARHVQHDVDMMFYLTEHERRASEHSMAEGLSFAFAFVADRVAKRQAPV